MTRLFPTVPRILVDAASRHRLGSSVPDQVFDPPKPYVYQEQGQKLPSLGHSGRGLASDRRVLRPLRPVPHEPYPHQLRFGQEALARYGQGQDRILRVSPTGAGKMRDGLSVMHALTEHWDALHQQNHLLKSGEGFAPATWRHWAGMQRGMIAPPGILVVAHRDYLVERWAKECGALFGRNKVGIWMGSQRNVQRSVVVAHISTLIHDPSRLNYDRFGLVVLDEAHHYVPDNHWGQVLFHANFLRANDDATWQRVGNWPRLLLSLTATPQRATGSALREIYGPQGLVAPVDAAELWSGDAAILRRPQVLDLQLSESPNAMTGRTLARSFLRVLRKNFKRHLGDVPQTIVYVNRVEQIAPFVKELQRANLSAEGLTRDVKDREAMLGRFESGATRVLVNCRIIFEGLHVGARLVGLMYASDSRSLVVQDVGRVMSRGDGAAEAWVIDAGDNVARHGLPLHTYERYDVDGRAMPIPHNESRGARHARRLKAGKVERMGAGEFVYDAPVTDHFQQVIRDLLPTERAVIETAYAAGLPQDTLFAYWNGLGIPRSHQAVLDLVQHVPHEYDRLTEAWAKERLVRDLAEHPIPDTVPAAQRMMVQELRLGVWQRYGGNLRAIPGNDAGVMSRYLEQPLRIHCSDFSVLSTVNRLFRTFVSEYRVAQWSIAMTRALEDSVVLSWNPEMLHYSEGDLLLYILQRYREHHGSVSAAEFFKQESVTSSRKRAYRAASASDWHSFLRAYNAPRDYAFRTAFLTLRAELGRMPLPGDFDATKSEGITWYEDGWLPSWRAVRGRYQRWDAVLANADLSEDDYTYADDVVLWQWISGTLLKRPAKVETIFKKWGMLYAEPSRALAEQRFGEDVLPMLIVAQTRGMGARVMELLKSRSQTQDHDAFVTQLRALYHEVRYYSVAQLIERFRTNLVDFNLRDDGASLTLQLNGGRYGSLKHSGVGQIFFAAQALLVANRRLTGRFVELLADAQTADEFRHATAVFRQEIEAHKAREAEENRVAAAQRAKAARLAEEARRAAAVIRADEAQQAQGDVAQDSRVAEVVSTPTSTATAPQRTDAQGVWVRDEPVAPQQSEARAIVRAETRTSRTVAAIQRGWKSFVKRVRGWFGRGE